jgi:putative iron transport system exported solute-binding component
MINRRTRAVAWLALPLVALSACSSPNTSPSASTEASDSAASQAITVKNCGQDLTVKSQAKKLYINDGNIIALALAAGASKEITAVSSVQRDLPILQAKYGTDTVNGLNQVSKDYPTLESILANTPDLVVAGWGYGFSEEKNLTPQALSDKGIPSYLLTESCRQEGSTNRGIVDPWEAVRTDINNLGELTGHSDVAKKAVDDMDTRLKAVQEAPKPEKKPVVFLFDSASDTVFTSGSYGAPNAIIETAGGTNATADVEDTWTKVSWERVATANPDIIAFVDYPPQTYEEKVNALKENALTKDLPAVQEERFVNLPYAMWTESPLNIDAAEYLRKTFEKHNLAPTSEVKTHLEMPADLAGKDKLP